MKERIKNSKALKWILIGAGLIAFGGACYFSWYSGLRTGCRETADESVQYIKTNFPDAYEMIMQQMSDPNFKGKFSEGE